MTDETEGLVRPTIVPINDAQQRANSDAEVEGTDPLQIETMRLFAQQHGGAFRYNHNRGIWMEWTGFTWRLDERTRSMYEMLQLTDRMRRLDPNRRKALGAIGFSKGALEGARSIPHLSVLQDDFDKNNDLLGTPVGYVDLATGKHHDPDRDKMISRSTSVAPAEGKPEKWLEFMEFATGGDKDLERYLQKFLGYCLSGHMHEEIMTFVYGPGGNGKGVMMSAVAHIMGTYYVNAPASTFMETKGNEHATELARLNGARLVSASETGEDDKWNLARIKEITGNENPISARFMRQDFFEFWPVCKLMIIGNNKPRMGEVDAAIARRLRMIEFTQQPRTVDPKLKDKMAGEYSRILQWMIDGYGMYLEDKGLEAPERVKQASAAYLASEDLVSQYLKDCFDREEGAYATRKDVSDLKSVWLMDNGIGSKLAIRGVYRKIDEGWGLETAERGRKRSFIGMKVKEEWMAALEMARQAKVKPK